MADAVDELIAASVRGDLARVTALVDGDSGLLGAMNMFGSSAIHAAYYSQRKDIVSFLFARGRQLDTSLLAELGMTDELRRTLTATPSLAKEFNALGSTPLHGACYWGAIDTARLLLEHGADPNAASRDSFIQIQPLGCAVATPDVPNPSQDGRVVLSLVDLLLDRGANINGRRLDGMTALHAAAYRGLSIVVRRLIERGADSTITALSGSHAGQTAADTATAQNQYEVAAFLNSLRT